MAAGVFPVLCLPLLTIVTSLDIGSNSPTGEWTSIFSGIRAFYPTTGCAAVSELGALSGWLLIFGMITLLVAMPVWMIQTIIKNWRPD